MFRPAEEPRRERGEEGERTASYIRVQKSHRREYNSGGKSSGGGKKSGAAKEDDWVQKGGVEGGKKGQQSRGWHPQDKATSRLHRIDAAYLLRRYDRARREGNCRKKVWEKDKSVRWSDAVAGGEGPTLDVPQGKGELA